MTQFETVGVIKNEPNFDENKLNDFYEDIINLRNKGTWTKEDILSLFKNILPDFNHKETGKYLDQKM